MATAATEIPSVFRIVSPPPFEVARFGPDHVAPRLRRICACGAPADGSPGCGLDRPPGPFANAPLRLVHPNSETGMFHARGWSLDLHRSDPGWPTSPRRGSERR